ncbi:rhodanese-like domain-containing protein [Alkalibacterium sp. MB6]|uniref:rhodanese-like domain-containing protein n=1 Tax=Alkalibacterium sp. MB6 TaxID=2081965 RepID=UPI0013795B09|nr:rhodanese-like domain-containing protein [Alkalibacterium sp. MB6]
MKQLAYSDINEQQLIDCRSQHDFQGGHLKQSLNLTASNFKKYATYYLDVDQPLVFIVGSKEEAELDNLSDSADDLGFNQVSGYIHVEDIPAEALETLGTTAPKDFLSKEDDYILLDVRHPDEITRPAPKKNLINIPFEDLITDYCSLDSEKVIYTLCGSGGRSTAAASFLKAKGLNPHVIEGGMKAVQELTD